MTQDEVIAELQAYDEGLAQILSRFRRDGSGIHIDLNDIPHFNQIGQEIIDLIADELVDGASIANHLGRLMYNSSENFMGTPSKAGVQSVKSALASIITRVGRNPKVLKSENLASDSSSRSTTPLVILERIASRLHVVIGQLRQRHNERDTLDVGDEYDLQDLAHALLRLFFDDVRPEEWVPSYAGGNSRMDFLLPVETTVIEFKMMRRSLTTAKLGEELIVDTARYRTHPKCRSLMCIVYDPDHRIENPRGLENDLSGKRDELEVRVIIVPN